MLLAYLLHSHSLFLRLVPLLCYHSSVLAKSPCPQGDSPSTIGPNLPMMYHLGAIPSIELELPRDSQLMMLTYSKPKWPKEK